MNQFSFSKIHGAGNDFIVTDESNYKMPDNPEFISRICDRQRGIGADGLIIISLSNNSDLPFPCFIMTYYNCDGGIAEMCGNGLRCAAYYANKYLNANSSQILFETGAGRLETHLLENNSIQIQIPLISLPEKVSVENREYYKVNTGVPHLIVPVDNISAINVNERGKALRNHELFKPNGTNVNFISISEPGAPVRIRTYERGIEGETSACGTGITAAAIALAKFKGYQSPIDFLTDDKDTITIDFCYNENIVEAFKDILLTGPVEEVFRGEYCR